MASECEFVSLILIRISFHTIQFEFGMFVKPQIIIRHNRSFVSPEHFKLVNTKQGKTHCTNQIIPLSMEPYIILFLMYNIASVLFQSHLAFDGKRLYTREGQ